MGARLRKQVRALVLRRYVRVRAQGADAYGRTLAAVRLRPAAFSGQASVALDSLLVVSGWAWAYDPEHAVAKRRREQELAQAAGRGLWKCSLAAPVRPGVWRAFNRQEKSTHWGSCSW
ncbi:thermonuclease family protein [Hymenobacter cellulosivorans]|uniref:Thermonuclease family protein n=2 Tax=Hymenobacter cellulosivorans TaxID=2932249 RepID=A0ABY4F510_9BACT|nr:thermonuclease family protein [Hymenobacter cellulosivorans]